MPQPPRKNHAAEVIPARQRASKLPPSLWWFLCISVACLLLSIISVALRVLLVHAPQHGLPSAIATRFPFADVYAYIRKVEFIHSPLMYTEGVRYYYPAPALFVYAFLHIFAGPAKVYARSAYALVFLATGAMVFLAARFALALQRRGLARSQAVTFAVLALITSWPIFYGLHQGNIETLLWIGVAVAVWAYAHDRWYLFAILIGIFGSVKLYPMLFLALCLRPKKFAPLLVSVATFAGITIAALAYIGPSVQVAFQRIQQGLHLFSTMNLGPHVVWPAAAMFEHSFVGLLHFLLDGHPHILMPLLKAYMPVMAALLTLLFFLRAWRLPPANQVLFITLICVTVPPISLDYTLELLYIPLAWVALLITQRAAAEEAVTGAKSAMVCFALVLAPELFLFIGVHDVYGEFKAVILAAMFFIALRFPFAERMPPDTSRALAV